MKQARTVRSTPPGPEAPTSTERTTPVYHANENSDNFDELELGLRLDADNFCSIPLGTMIDALVEHDISDPNLGNASRWPWWCDQFTLELGPDPTFDPLPDDDLDDLRVEF
jgi:hypothetical protein